MQCASEEVHPRTLGIDSVHSVSPGPLAYLQKSRLGSFTAFHRSSIHDAHSINPQRFFLLDGFEPNDNVSNAHATDMIVVWP